MIGGAPVRKSFEGGGSITSFSVATDDSYVRNGEVHKRTDWHKVSVNDDKFAEVMERILSKGYDLSCVRFVVST